MPTSSRRRSSSRSKAIRIYTGNAQFTPGFMTLEIWSHDPTTNAPHARLCGGTWRIWPQLGTTWQGTNLDAVMALVANTAYWIVWTEPGSSQVPDDPTGVRLPYASRPAASTTWTAGLHGGLKWRLYCSRLDAPGVTPFGVPCATSQGKLGGTFTNQAPMIGNSSFAFEASGFPAAHAAVLLLGVNPGWTSVFPAGLPFGCQLHTDIVVSLPGTTGTGDVRANAFTVGAAGHASFVLGIPPAPALIGLYVAGQVAVHDPAITTALIPVPTTNALRLRIY
jgi:hypothetical protein